MRRCSATCRRHLDYSVRARLQLATDYFISLSWQICMYSIIVIKMGSRPVYWLSKISNRSKATLLWKVSIKTDSWRLKLQSFKAYVWRIFTSAYLAINELSEDMNIKICCEGVGEELNLSCACYWVSCRIAISASFYYSLANYSLKSCSTISVLCG